jgi:OmpR family two-component system bacitracin resistance sensor histidine kinase BceS
VLVAAVDVSLPLLPVLYITLLSATVCLFFLGARYQQETAFYRQLAALDTTFRPAMAISAASPFERIVEVALSEQNHHYQSNASTHFQLLEQEKNELLAWIHEVKTPLTAMKLTMDRLPEDTAKARLEYEWLRIHLLLDRQMHERRLPFIENDLFVEETELTPLLSREIRELKSWCMQKGIGFELDLHAERVRTDAKWLAFILRQLLTNAVKYSEASDIKVRSREENGHVIVEVEDAGRGISARDLPRIFEKGFTSTTQHVDHAATGMGLYLARKAADTLHIRIEVESVYGNGTTMRLCFPVANAFVRMTGM